MADDSSSDNTYINLAFFLLITILFFAYLKPKPTIDTLLTPASPYKAYGIYFGLILILEIYSNNAIMKSKCGEGSESNLGYIMLLTFGSWIAMFGILIGVLMVFPAMKSPFSDVIGYYAVANSANKLFAEMLVNTEINEKINEAGEGVDEIKTQSMQSAAEAVIKMMGNVSILINEIVPENFTSYWETLEPLIKPTLSPADVLDKKEKLLDIVVLRDNIGEACWYIYTAVLLISIVGYKVATKKCEVDPKVANANYEKYLDKQQALDDASTIANSIPYTLN